MLLPYLSHSDRMMARIILWHWGAITTVPPLPILFCFVACGSTVFYKFQPLAKGKFPSVGLAGVKALDVPGLGAVCTAMGRIPVLAVSSLTHWLCHVTLNWASQTGQSAPSLWNPAHFFSWTLLEKLQIHIFFPKGVFKLFLFPVLLLLFLFVCSFVVCWIWGGSL